SLCNIGRRETRCAAAHGLWENSQSAFVVQTNSCPALLAAVVTGLPQTIDASNRRERLFAAAQYGTVQSATLPFAEITRGFEPAWRSRRLIRIVYEDLAKSGGCPGDSTCSI